MGKDKSLDNLWLAQTLFDIGAVEFGEFSISHSAAKSPIFINPKKLVSNPMALRVAATLMQQEIELSQNLRRSRISQFEVVAGIPVGGLILSVAYTLQTSTPTIYPRMQQQGSGQRGIEGKFQPGARALIIDDLITTGGSIIETARFLADNDIIVKDAVVLIDRDQGAADYLRQHGYNLMSILKLDVMLNYYHTHSMIKSETYEQCIHYLREHRAPEVPPMDVIPGPDDYGVDTSQEN